MSELPQVSGRECIRALERLGYYVHRQKGSHVIMRQDKPKTTIVVPNHKQLKAGTLRSIISKARITVDEFKENL